MNMRIILLLVCMLIPVIRMPAREASGDRPNVILVMTDDQGIGDLGCHGNPWLKTPHLDAFYEESVRMTDFHVSPLCTPTRSALITGRYPVNNGAWATFKGRDLLSRSASPTLPEVFQMNGYRTAMFGKWHLGDNYPARPTDLGFEYAVQHSSGGVGELSDHWGNSYFDDIYLVNNEPRSFNGYCTDVWFGEAMRYMDEHAAEPFFIYLPTNAPHAPLLVEEACALPYRDMEGKLIPSAPFYGMIANVDENFGKLVAFLEERGLEENTILIFMTDNGSQFGVSADYRLGYSKGFRGRKGEREEAGHRVPFFIRWPEGGIAGGKDLDALTTHVDLLPTLASLCGITIPEDKVLDGKDFSSLLLGGHEWEEDRTVFVHHRQSWLAPDPVEGTCILQGKWRLINGRELYDIRADPFQEKDLSGVHPELVTQLLEENARFCENASQERAFRELPAPVAGSDHQQVIRLTVQHAMGDDRAIWESKQVAEGMKVANARHMLETYREGIYRISCCRWPRECPGPIWGIPASNPKDMFLYRSIRPDSVRLLIDGKTYQKEVGEGDTELSFDLQLPAGRHQLETWFLEKGEAYGVYYTYVEKLP